MLYCFHTCNCIVFSMPTMMAVWKTLYWIMMMLTMQVRRLPDLWGGYSISYQAFFTKFEALTSLADMKLLFISQVVVLTDSGACLRKTQTYLWANMLSWLEFVDQAGNPGFGFVINIIKKSSWKEGSHFWKLKRSSHPEGSSPNRATWKLAFPVRVGSWLVVGCSISSISFFQPSR